MHTQALTRELMSILLAAALFLCPILPAAAAAQETVPAQTLAEETLPPETTGETIPPVTGEETLPPETTAETLPPETTEAATEPAQVPTEPSATPVTIRQALSMAAGTENLTLVGTVVYLSGNQAVLQDSTGGIRLVFAAAPCASLGDQLRITGSRSGGFVVTDYENLGPGTLPAVQTTLLAAEEMLRVWIRDAQLGYGALTQGGFSLPLSADLADAAAAGSQVDAWGVILDGCFYADTIAPAAQARTEEKPVWKHYFGLLHAHTSFSDGTGTVEEAFSYAAQVKNLDFFAVTDHSDSFDNAVFGALDKDGSLISTEWARGKEAAAAVTGKGFVGIFGYEMTWPEDRALGHINTFHTPGWQTRDQFDSLEDYCQALGKIPGAVSQFNHPSHAYGTFHNFSRYTPEQDAVMHLVEVDSGDSRDPYAYYIMALDAGWHLAPANNQNNHNGFWGDASGVRTVVLAKELTEPAIYDAIANYRVYATEDPELTIDYTLNGALMGSILPLQEQLTAAFSLSSPAALVEVVGTGGQVLASWENTDKGTGPVPQQSDYYFLRVTQADGDTAVTAPVWVDSFEDMGIALWEADNPQPELGQSVSLKLELFNNESEAFSLESIEFFQGETSLHLVADPGAVQPGQRLPYELPFTGEQAGTVQLTVQVTGSVLGQSRSYTRTLSLPVQDPQVTSCDIARLRTGIPGESYRIRGYVTAGTSNPYTTFPDTVYIQDSTGGIAVTGLSGEKLEIGTAIEVTGSLGMQQENPVLDRTEHTLLSENPYRWDPRVTANKTAMDYEAHGGQLLQIQGTVVSLTKTADGKGVSRFTIQDILGDRATVLIEDSIRSGAYGANQLAAQVKKGRTVRVLGLLHKDEFGQTVLRVRNCDEVVYVPARRDPTNPQTGDWLRRFWG